MTLLTNGTKLEIVTEVEYFFPDNPFVICPNCLIWSLTDIFPKFPRLIEYLEHWKLRVETDISQVRIWHPLVDEPVVITPERTWNLADKYLLN